MNGYFMTDKGRVRSHNEDSGGVYINSAQQILAVIADGMGGHKAGDVASHMAASGLKEKWEETSAFSSPDQAEEWLTRKIKEVNDSILRHAEQNEGCRGMGTTIVAVICTRDFITISHIGDSRCYLANGQGFKQLTEDHSLVNELVRSGQITKNDADHHPRKNVLLKALGTEPDVQADVSSIGWEVGNSLLLCSDGLSNKVEDREISDKMQLPIGLESIAQRLIDLANERGGEDNISLVLVRYDDLQGEGGS
ncbi:Stp1/IreP family PP2C-type Ser/Thr phosphatase [Sediminibacillus massiliensis]|uniref:Stp1/IreP family PP2C-type Ser/Thr phosphatase n=1 Tax=Sediminibacillus massiliensis TaxID=1926277 RepID=UPI0009886623|nr:Stp1/IreP family PP2C-type Ser/Thr phosphatase [Sediminibacillus massiliensis]